MTAPDPARGNAAWQVVSLGALFIAATLLTFGAIAWFAAAVGTVLRRSPRVQRWMNQAWQAASSSPSTGSPSPSVECARKSTHNESAAPKGRLYCVAPGVTLRGAVLLQLRVHQLHRLVEHRRAAALLPCDTLYEAIDALDVGRAAIERARGRRRLCSDSAALAYFSNGTRSLHPRPGPCTASPPSVHVARGVEIAMHRVLDRRMPSFVTQR